MAFPEGPRPITHNPRQEKYNTFRRRTFSRRESLLSGIFVGKEVLLSLLSSDLPFPDDV